MAASLSWCGAEVRRLDRDRFLTALFSPAACRESLFALYAFNLEVAKTREIVSEPMLGHIRLQWWRDVLDELYAGKVRQHPVLLALEGPVRAGYLPHSAFNALIDARERDLEDDPPSDLAALESYSAATSGELTALAVRLTGAGEGDVPDVALYAARRIGTAWSLIGLMRAVAFHAQARRLFLPADLMTEFGIDRGALFDLKPTPKLDHLVRGVVAHANELLVDARNRRGEVPRSARGPLLLAKLADVHLTEMARHDYDVFALPPSSPPRPIRLLAAYLAGRY